MGLDRHDGEHYWNSDCEMDIMKTILATQQSASRPLEQSYSMIAEEKKYTIWHDH